MTILYNLGIRVYYLLVLIVSIFNKKAKLWINGRKNCVRRISEQIERNKEYAWFHVSSLGEFEQGRPIMEALKRQSPELGIVLTFFSPSGYEIRKNYSGADIISYLPLDTYRNAKRFIQTVNPKYTFFVKYEFWRHFLRQASKSDSKLFLVSGIFRNNQLFFRSYGGWYKRMLTWFDYFFVQNEESSLLLQSIGLKNVEVTGDTRFDRVLEIATKKKQIEKAEAFSKDAFVCVCGSTWEPDENLLVKYLEETGSNFKLIVAPHVIKEEKIQALEEKSPVISSRFSTAKIKELADARLLIIDNIGMLSSLYNYGQLAYIGGGFGVGIHNTLEAAVYGIPVIFGPNYRKFSEAIDLIEHKGGFSISDFSELKSILDKLINEPNYLKQSGKNAVGLVERQSGATLRIISKVIAYQS